MRTSAKVIGFWIVVGVVSIFYSPIRYGILAIFALLCLALLGLGVVASLGSSKSSRMVGKKAYPSHLEWTAITGPREMDEALVNQWKLELDRELSHLN